MSLFRNFRPGTCRALPGNQLHFGADFLWVQNRRYRHYEPPATGPSFSEAWELFFGAAVLLAQKARLGITGRQQQAVFFSSWRRPFSEARKRVREHGPLAKVREYGPLAASPIRPSVACCLGVSHGPCSETGSCFLELASSQFRKGVVCGAGPLPEAWGVWRRLRRSCILEPVSCRFRKQRKHYGPPPPAAPIYPSVGSMPFGCGARVLF